MKPSNKNDGKKRKKEGNTKEPESPKRSKVHAQRKFAQGAGVASPIISPIKERDKPRSSVTNVAAPAEPLLQSRVPKTVDFLTFLCFQHTSLLPPELNFLKEATANPATTSTQASQQTSKQTTKKSDKGDDGKKQAAGVQALRKKYKEQRIAKQKATSMTKLAKKVKGKNMVRSTRSTAVVEDVRKARVDNRNKAKAKIAGLRSGVKRAGRPPNVNKNITKVIKKNKLLRAGLRSGGAVQEPKNPPKTQPISKAKRMEKQEDVKKTVQVQPVEISSPPAAPVKILRHKKSRAEREIGSDFSSDDNEPLLSRKRPQTRKKNQPEVECPKVETRPSRRTKVAAAAYVESITRKLVSPTGDDDQAFEGFPELPHSRRFEKRELEKKVMPATSKKASVENKVPQKIVKVKKDLVKKPGAPKLVKKVKKAVVETSRPSTRSSSQDSLKNVAFKKPALRSLIQKKKLISVQRLTKLKKIKSIVGARRKMIKSDVAEKETVKSDKVKCEASLSENKKDESKSEEETPTRKLRGKNPETSPFPAAKSPALEKAKKHKVEVPDKESIVEKPKKIRKKIEVGIGALSKRPVRKCSTIDKIWIDIDGFTSDEDDFIDIESLAENKITKKEDEEGENSTKEKVSAQTNERDGKKLELTTLAVDSISSSQPLDAQFKKATKSNAEVKVKVSSKVLQLNIPESSKINETSKTAEKPKSESQTPLNANIVKTNVQVSIPNATHIVNSTVNLPSIPIALEKVDKPNISPKKLPADPMAKIPVVSIPKSVNASEINLNSPIISSKAKVSSNEQKMLFLSTTNTNVPKLNPFTATTAKTSPINCTPSEAGINIRKSQTVTAEVNIPSVSHQTTKAEIEDSHALIARLAETVSMTAQPTIAKAITKDLKLFTTSLHSELIKEEKVEKSEVIKSEEVKNCEGNNEKKVVADLCNKSLKDSSLDTKIGLPDTAVKKLFQDKKESPVKVDSTALKDDVCNVPEFKSVTKPDAYKQIKVNEVKPILSSQITKPPSSSSSNATIEINHISENLNISQKKVDLQKNNNLDKQDNSLFVSQSSFSNSSAAPSNKPINNQNLVNHPNKVLKPSTKDDKSGPSKADGNPRVINTVKEDKKAEAKGKQCKEVDKRMLSATKEKSSKVTKSNAGRRKRGPIQRATLEPALESTRRERPKRQCSAGGKSWIERDSDDSSFYPSDEEILELIRQSELAERKKKEKTEKRKSAVTKIDEPLETVKEKKDVDNFSDSDDEPLKKKSISSNSPTFTLSQGLSRSVETTTASIPKNSPGTSEAPQERDTRAGASGATETSPLAVTFVHPPMREPINTHGLDLLSEVVTFGAMSRDSAIDKPTARIEQWINESRRADSGKGFLGFDESEIQRPTLASVPAIPSYSNAPDPIVQFFRTPSELPKSQPQLAPVMTTSIAIATSPPSLSPNHEQLEKQIEHTERPKPMVLAKNQEASFKRKPVASVQELLKLRKERMEAPPKPPADKQHSRNCQCNGCVVKKGWFKNKPMPEETKPVNKEASPAKPFQSLLNAYSEATNAKPETDSANNGRVTSNSSTTPKKLSFLERMRERERNSAPTKPSASAFSANNEKSVYAFDDASPSGSGGSTFRNNSTSSSHSDFEEDKNRHQSTSIAVQVNLDEMENPAPDPAPSAPPDDGKSNEISTQTEGADDDPDSAMFYIPLEESGSSQPLIQGVTLKLDAEGPMGPTRRVVMKAKLVTKAATTPNLKAVVMPLQKLLERPKSTNTPPVVTVQPTSRGQPTIALATATRAAIPREEGSRVSLRRSADISVPSTSRSRNMRTEEIQISSVVQPLPSCSSASLAHVVARTQSPREQCPSPPSPLHSQEKEIAEPARRVSPEPKASCSSTNDPPTPASVVDAPTFYLTEKEFQDPLEFFERIRPEAERFGICRIVPPSSFKPDCKVTDDMRFTAYNQYVHRMLHRWGPSVRETMAMKKYLKTQSISLKPPPCVGGLEIDLPRLYKAVQTCGGLMKVMEKHKWQQVADLLRIPKAAHDRATKLDVIYCQYLLPYDTLETDKRDQLLKDVDADWSLHEEKMGTNSEDTEEDDEDENYIEECEECIVKGRNMALSQFYRIARNTMSMWFKSPEPSPTEVETEFWRHVNERSHHVCVHSGSIDSSGYGYGFPVGKNNFAKHPWNLKVLTNNSGSVLRSLGPVMGVTVPTLHVGMVFTAFCWYRDPHGLPWIEYLHTGAPKIWYGISDDNSELFRDALTKLLPRHIKNQRIWLPCDTAMAPPSRLAELGVPLSRITQEPGQFVLVFPRAFTSSLCTGYLVSESVYFALPSWLQTAEQVFRDIHDSAEPSAFSLDNLLFSIAGDCRASLDVLQQVLPMVQKVHQRELALRRALANLGIVSEKLPRETNRRRGKNVDPEPEHECEVCRASLFLSLVSIAAEESVFCLTHGLQQLTDHPDQISGSKHLYLFDEDEVNQVVEKLMERIDVKLLKSSKK